MECICYWANDFCHRERDSWDGGLQVRLINDDREAVRPHLELDETDHE